MDDLIDALIQDLEENATKSRVKMDKAWDQMIKDLYTKHPELMEAKLEKIENTAITAYFDEVPIASDSWDKLCNWLESDILKKAASEIGKSLNKPIQGDDLKKLLRIERKDKDNQFRNISCLPKQEIGKFRQDSDDFRIQTIIEICKILRQPPIDIARNIGQISPDICMTLIFPTSSRLNILRYRTEDGKTKENYIYGLPSVTLDTDIFLKMKRGEYMDMLEFRETYLADLAISQRIREDVQLRQCEEQFLSDYYIRKIPSIMHCSFDSKAQRYLLNPKFNKPGSIEFVKSAESIVNNFFKPKGETPPGYLDWDHLHAHYLYERDIFLTDDKKILKIKEQLKEELGIVVMNFEDFVNTFKNNNDLIESFGKVISMSAIK